MKKKGIVALQRIKDFLLLEEMNDSQITHQEEQG